MGMSVRFASLRRPILPNKHSWRFTFRTSFKPRTTTLTITDLRIDSRTLYAEFWVGIAGRQSQKEKGRSANSHSAQSQRNNNILSLAFEPWASVLFSSPVSQKAPLPRLSVASRYPLDSVWRRP